MGEKAGPWEKVEIQSSEPSPTALQGIVVSLTNLLLVPITVWGNVSPSINSGLMRSG